MTNNVTTYKDIIMSNLIKTLKPFSYELVKTLELEKGMENCVFKENNNNIVLYTFSYTPSSSPLNQEKDRHYLNNGFYRKEINGITGYYGLINESGREWEKFTYLQNNKTLIMTISRLIESAISIKALVKDYTQT